MSRAEDSERPVVLTIVGPTAVGKTAVALDVATSLGGEIVSADSRQVYTGMDVGTAKPTRAERERARHHLIDIVEPREAYDAARFARDAENAVEDIRARGATPLVVGGTGFYLASLFEGLFEGPGRDEELRDELSDRASEQGTDALHRELAAVDPDSAARIHENDTSRVVRALEVYLTTGRTLTEWHSEESRSPRVSPCYFGLTMPRESLYRRIDGRVDAMVADGLLSEVGELVASGRLASGMPAASAVGYRELLPLFERGGEGPPDSDSPEVAVAIELIKRNTRRYAKRQMTWFTSIEGVEWIDLEDSGAGEAARRIVSSRCT